MRQYIANATGGDPETLVQMTIFRMVPWEHDACRRLPTARRAGQLPAVGPAGRGRGIGDAHVALILQPDGPFALCAPGGSQLPSRLIAYAAKTFSALAHTSVYIDGGASDWPEGPSRRSPRASWCPPASSTRAASPSTPPTTRPPPTRSPSAPAWSPSWPRRGAPGKHFVINTSSNGQPFDFGQARGSHPDNAEGLRHPDRGPVRHARHPAHRRRGRPGVGPVDANRARARANVDGYLWFGRPWLYMQADPFVMKRALQLARTTPY